MASVETEREREKKNPYMKIKFMLPGLLVGSR